MKTPPRAAIALGPETVARALAGAGPAAVSPAGPASGAEVMHTLATSTGERVATISDRTFLGAVAWFVWPPEMDGRLKLHGVHGQQASWFEHGKGDGRD